MTRQFQPGDLVKLFDGAYSTGTIISTTATTADVVRPFLYATEAGGWTVSVEIVRAMRLDRLVPAEVGSDGNPRKMLHGLYTYEDLKKVASGEWKL